MSLFCYTKKVPAKNDTYTKQNPQNQAPKIFYNYREKKISLLLILKFQTPAAHIKNNNNRIIDEFKATIFNLNCIITI